MVALGLQTHFEVGRRLPAQLRGEKSRTFVIGRLGREVASLYDIKKSKAIPSLGRQAQQHGLDLAPQKTTALGLRGA